MNNSAIQLECSDEGLERVRLQWNGSEALVYLQGAHVTEYAPAGLGNILWVSESSLFQPGKAIRGGIPICWPWFGPHSGAERPQHGYARQSTFVLESAEAKDDYAQAVFRLDASATPFEEWRGKLDLEVEIRLSDQLWMEMRSQNLSDQAQAISTCLHSYFAVQDVREIKLPELYQKSYLDKVIAGEQCIQNEPVSVGAELDRIYLDTPESVQLQDALADRQIQISSWGCEHLVVWNPWEEKAKQMQDFDDQGYLKMICVEPANALPGSLDLMPGETHIAGQEIKLTGG